MEWLTQNWIWLALGIGALVMLSRGAHGGHGGHGGCCGGGGHGEDAGHGSTSTKPAAGSIPGHQHH